MAGRGNANVHVVTHKHTALKTDAGNNQVPNIIGPEFTTSQNARILDAERTINFLLDKNRPATYETFDDTQGFHSSMIMGNPDDLKRTKTIDVASRAKTWKSALLDLPFKTDISQMLGAAYVAGMISPGQTSRFMAVNKAMIQDSDIWLGKIRTFKDMSKIKIPTEHLSEDDPQKDALVFLASLV